MRAPMRFACVSWLVPAGDGGGGGACAAELTAPWSEEVLAEARARLVAGLKRYFHAKRGEGLLSSEGLRILDYACDTAADRAGEPLVSVSSGKAAAGLRPACCRPLRFSHAGATPAHARVLTICSLPPPLYLAQAVWDIAEREVVGRYTVRALAWLFYNAKRLVGRLPRLLRAPLRPPLRYFASEWAGVGWVHGVDAWVGWGFHG